MPMSRSDLRGASLASTRSGSKVPNLRGSPGGTILLARTGRGCGPGVRARRGRRPRRPRTLGRRLTDRMECSAVGTVVERKTRYTLLVYLPREEGCRHKGTPKNGPALAGYGAITMKNGPREHDVDAANPAGAVADLGPREGDVRARPVPRRDGYAGVLRRLPITLAATNERKHQRTSPVVLPEGQGPLPLVRRGHRGGRSRAEHLATENARLEDPRRSIQRATVVVPTSRCCSDRLSPVFFPGCYFANNGWGSLSRLILGASVGCWRG